MNDFICSETPASFFVAGASPARRIDEQHATASRRVVRMRGRV
jgi:hypothetical protein